MLHRPSLASSEVKEGHGVGRKEWEGMQQVIPEAGRWGVGGRTKNWHMYQNISHSWAVQDSSGFRGVVPPLEMMLILIVPLFLFLG